LTTGQLGYAYAIAGNRDGALQLLNVALERANRGDFPAFAIAQIYIGLGERDRAFEWLRKAVDERDVYLSLKVDPIYDPLRADPRFKDLLRRVKLAL